MTYRFLSGQYAVLADRDTRYQVGDTLVLSFPIPGTALFGGVRYPAPTGVCRIPAARLRAENPVSYETAAGALYRCEPIRMEEDRLLPGGFDPARVLIAQQDEIDRLTLKLNRQQEKTDALLSEISLPSLFL